MSDTASAAGGPTADALIKPLARLLRPLVRLLIDRGITFPAFAELLRELYVDVAERDFALSGKGQTDSRVNLLTGIHRKEVRRLREAGAQVNDVPASLSLGSQVIARWAGAAPFIDETGSPRPLPRQSADDGEPSFESLVESVTKDVRPRAILDEWLNRQIVTIDAAGLVHLGMSAYVPQAGDSESLYYFGRNLGDHIAAAGANILGPERRFFDRAIHYDGLTPEGVAKLDALGRKGAMKLLLDLNRAAQAITAEDDGKNGTGRFNLGIFLYRADDRSEDKV